MTPPPVPDPKDFLRQKFPDMEPISSPPTMFRLNGFGIGVYGRRDFDASTNSYIKTLCICFLFVPVLALRAYRVIDGEAGAFGSTSSWYFLGRHRLSAFARGWNYSVLGLAAFGIFNVWWAAHTSSPEYKAGEDLQQAAAHVKEGRPDKAAGIYRRVAEGGHQVEAARTGLKAAVEQCLASTDPGQAAMACRVAASLPPRLNQPAPVVPDLLGRGLALVEKFKPGNPEGALDILRAVAPLAPTNTPVRPQEIALLQQVLTKKPDDTNRAVELALIFESEPNPEASARTLLPFKGRLGSTEGARILGQHLLQQGDYSDAYAHLHPYVQTRLTQLHKLERDYTNAVHSVSEGAVEDLRKGRGPSEFYNVYKGASEDAKQRMVDDFINERIKTSTQVRQARAALSAGGEIVNVALDLGIVQLNRAQGMASPAERKQELEAAEKTFLAIRSFVGGTDSYRMFLGQVYYWLGRSPEGEALFEELLKSKQRSFGILLSLSRSLRDVGERRKARLLVEEAWGKGPSEKEKFAAAQFRSVLATNIEDKVTWLRRADVASTEVQVELNSALGDKALEAGDREQAVRYLQLAIAGYEKWPKTSTSLNNCGLVYFTLSDATGDLRHHDRGLQMIEEACALEPGNSILLDNLTQFQISRACLDVTKDRLRWDLLRSSPSLSALPSTYGDDGQRNEVYARLKENPYLKKALANLDKAMLLAPKSASLYATAQWLQSGFRDLNELKKLKSRMETANLDRLASADEVLSTYTGKRDQETLQRLSQSIGQVEARLQSYGAEVGVATRDYASLELAALRLGAAQYGQKTDLPGLSGTLRAVHERQPSATSFRVLAVSLLAQAEEQLSAQSTEYAQLVSRTRRSVEPLHRVAAVLDQGGPLAELVAVSPRVQEVLQLRREERRRFTISSLPVDWAILRRSTPQEAEAIASQIRQNEVQLLVEEISYQLSPLSAAEVLDQYWIARILNQEAKAADIYQTAVKRGVPLPPLAK